MFQNPFKGVIICNQKKILLILFHPTNPRLVFELAQRRCFEPGNEGDNQRHAAAENNRGYGTKHSCCKTTFKLPHLVAAVHKHRIDRGNPAPHFIGRG